MRYGIFSDIHSNLEALDSVLDSYKHEAIDRYFCIGDIVGYAANPNECIELIRSKNVVCVAGNHDWASVGLFALDNFNPLAKEAVIWTRTRLNSDNIDYLQSLDLIYSDDDFTMVHGTLDRPQEFNYMSGGYTAWDSFEAMDNHICFVGHTHVPEIYIRKPDDYLESRKEDILSIEDDCSYIVNVGSTGQPRDGDRRAAYCIYDTQKRKLEIRRIDYDFLQTKRKITDAGLPEFLAQRLEIGR
ncbi:MAG: metallophosphoesterase [Candidatus Omnitrophota bacterium]|jgi:predicted phosphodiesterase|nr:MAG: metallophosphoesterase [Candidatus Omnitrophota bacterium]